MTDTLADTPVVSPSRPVRVLRGILVADAVAGSVTAFGLLVLTTAWSEMLGVEPSLLQGAGVILIGYVVALVVATRRPRVPLVRGIIVANLAWVVACIVVLALVGPTATVFGVVYVIGQALVVTGFAVAEWCALRRLRD